MKQLSSREKFIKAISREGRVWEILQNILIGVLLVCIGIELIMAVSGIMLLIAITITSR